MGPRLLLNLREAHCHSASDTLNSGHNSTAPVYKISMRPPGSEDAPKLRWVHGSRDVAIELDVLNWGKPHNWETGFVNVMVEQKTTQLPVYIIVVAKLSLQCPFMWIIIKEKWPLRRRNFVLHATKALSDSLGTDRILMFGASECSSWFLHFAVNG